MRAAAGCGSATGKPRCVRIFATVAPWQVHTLAGVATGQFLRLLRQPAALARLWRLDVATGAITRVELELATLSRRPAGEWRFAVSDTALQSMCRLPEVAERRCDTPAQYVGDAPHKLTLASQ